MRRCQTSPLMVPLFDRLYDPIIRPLAFRMDAERAHRMVLAGLSVLGRTGTLRDPPELATVLWGIRFSNPIGLAAGLDKDGCAIAAWQRIGFGFAEVGTVTARPQPGNPRPRIWRLPEHRAIINRMGFPSAGMEAVARRLEKIRTRRLDLRIGVNIGPNRDTPESEVAGDYAALMKRMAPLADFVVINVSSPNTPGLREWQAPERMREITQALADASAQSGALRPPVLIKIAPDLEISMLEEICDTAAALKLDGIVATNTTLAREDVGVISPLAGGLSGQPLTARARAFIREIHRHTQGALPIIGVGGVSSAEEAYEHIRAGASLVELYTGLIYEGPGLIARLKEGLMHLLRRDGLSTIGQAVGSAG